MVSMTKTEALCESAQKHLHKKELADAIDLYEQAIEMNERCCDAHEGIATAYYLGKDYHSSAEHFKKVTLLRPTDGKVLINYGCVLNLLEKFSEAVKALQKGSLRKKKSFEAFYNLGLAYKGMNQTAMAVSAYKESIRLSPDNLDAHQNIANVYIDMQNLKKAIEHYQKALELNPDFEKARIGLENALTLQEEAKQSVSPFGRLVDTSHAAKAVITTERELSVEERHDDRKKVRELSKKSEVVSKSLVAFLKKEFEPSVLKLNRSVAEMTETPWQLTEAEEDFRATVRQLALLRKQLKRKMLELLAHEEIMHTPE